MSNEVRRSADLAVVQVEQHTDTFLVPTGPRHIPRAVVFGTFLVATILLQMWTGAYRTGRGSFPDEAAHFMNGLLVRDYLRDGLGSNPMQFARQYYLHYPKIAPGMWPPLYDGVLGVLLLPGWSPHVVALLLVGCATAWTAWRLSRILSCITRPWLAFLLAGLFLCTPVVVNLSNAVMLDIVVAAFALEATFWLARFFDSGCRRHGVLFGIFATGACLSKGNGLAVLLMPVLLLLFTRRFELLRRSGLYLAAAIVLIFAGPLLTVSVYLSTAIGAFAVTTWSDALERMGFYWDYLVGQLGLPVLVVAGIALLTAMRPGRASSNRPQSALIPSLAALVLAALLFHLLNPHSVFDGRYITLAVAPIFGLLPVGVRACLVVGRQSTWRNALRTGLVTAMVASAVLMGPGFAFRYPLGFRDAADFIEARSGLAGRRMMVVSEETGEGAFVAEVAARHPEPAATVLRASKILGTDAWNGHQFKLAFHSSAALLQELEDLHVDYLVIDRSLQADNHELWAPTFGLLREQASRLTQVYSAAGTRPIVVYQLRYRSPGPPKTPAMTISSPLGRW